VYKLTQSIEVPVCVACRAALVKRRRVCAVVALLGGILVGLSSWYAARIGDATLPAWLALPVNGGIFAWVLWLGLSEAAGVRLPRFGHGGSRVFFADHGYQQEFDQVNGFPEAQIANKLTVRQRLEMLGFAITLLFVGGLLASTLFVVTGGVATILYPGALLAVAITALAAGFAGITGKPGVFAWILRSVHHVEEQKGDERVIRLLEERGIQLPSAEEQGLSPAVQWGILLGAVVLLGAMLGLPIWLAMRN
jgi:hypothetical protein